MGKVSDHLCLRREGVGEMRGNKKNKTKFDSISTPSVSQYTLHDIPCK